MDSSNLFESVNTSFQYSISYERRPLNKEVSFRQLLPVPKFIKGLNPSLHIVQTASYEEMNPIARKITYKLLSLPSLVVFHCVVTRL